MNKKLKIVLMVSLAINFIMLGFFIGNTGKRHWHSGYAHEKGFNESRMHKGPLRRVLSHLPDEQKMQAKREMRELREQNKATLQTLKTLRQQLKTTVNAEPFDQAKFIEVTTKIRQLKNQMEHRHTQYIAQILARLPEEKRAKVMRHFFKRHHGRHSE